MAELKLLRTRQQLLHDMTRLVDTDPKLDQTLRGAILDDLSEQQQDLAETGDRLIRKMRQQTVDQPLAPEKQP